MGLDIRYIEWITYHMSWLPPVQDRDEHGLTPRQVDGKLERCTDLFYFTPTYLVLHGVIIMTSLFNKYEELA